MSDKKEHKQKSNLPSLDDVMEAVHSDDSLGFCIECGAEASDVEPDARGYECEVCGANKVYGAEEILLMGAYQS